MAYGFREREKNTNEYQVLMRFIATWFTWKLKELVTLGQTWNSTRNYSIRSSEKKNRKYILAAFYNHMLIDLATPSWQFDLSVLTRNSPSLRVSKGFSNIIRQVVSIQFSQLCAKELTLCPFLRCFQIISIHECPQMHMLLSVICFFFRFGRNSVQQCYNLHFIESLQKCSDVDKILQRSPYNISVVNVAVNIVVWLK